MKGLCKTECGMTVEYVPHEFSDGFVYYLPRNLDKTIHHCMIIEMEMEMWGDPDPNIEKIYHENKDRLKITQEKFIKILHDQQYDPYSFLGDEELDVMTLLRKGKMYELKKHVENQLDTLTIPYFQSRFPMNGNQNETIEMANNPRTTVTLPAHNGWFVVTKPIDEVCSLILPLLPTGNGYQLEFLGYLYEIMLRLEDAKKCYDLQYECTKEFELLEKSKELDDKIKEMDKTRKVTENIPDNLTTEDIRKKIDSTELNIRKYVVSLFSNNFNKLFRRNPSLLLDIQKIRKNDEESMIEVNENSDIETFGLGSIAYILKISKGQIKSNRHQTCSVCGINWKKGEFIFLEKHPKKIICSDKICFQHQGGFTKSIPLSLIHRIQNISKIRNLHDHPRDYDKEMYKKMLKESYETCNVIDHFIERELTNIKST